MARRIKISSGVLNVRLHPHSPDIYREFMLDAYRLKKPVSIKGERYAILSLLEKKEADDGYISGYITTFTRIDSDGNWFDAANLTEASDQQVAQINIPDNLFPNASAFHFSFDINKHRLYFQTYSKGRAFTVGSAMRLFEGLANDLKMLAKYPTPTITPVQSQEGLAGLFALPRIKEIKITILKPNPDVFDDDFEAEIERELEESHSRKVVIAFEADKGGSVVPTPSIRRASEAALDNGRVDVNGRNETGAVKLSTDDFPEIIQDKYDPDEETENNAFKRIIGRG